MLRAIALGTILIPSFGLAGEGVFGLRPGMTIDQVRSVELGQLRQSSSRADLYIIQDPKKPQGVEDIYLTVHPRNGLLKVSAYWAVESNTHGHGVKSKFRELRSIVAKKYGKGETIDRLHPGSYWHEPQYWMMALHKEERELLWYKIWRPQPNQWKLEAISIDAKARDVNTGQISLHYEFEGFSAYVDRQKAKQHSEF